MAKTKTTKVQRKHEKFVTHREFSAHMGAIKRDLDSLSDRLNQTATKDDLKGFATKADLKSDIQQLRGEIQQTKEEIVHEFKAVAENIHQDLPTGRQVLPVLTATKFQR
ncbi:MAG: hypothetical protein WD972_00210 [Candidatus Andersenbacteria bacterium]